MRRTGGEEIEKEACFVLGLLAIKAEHQHAIADKGALTGLVGLLKQHVPSRCSCCLLDTSLPNRFQST